MNKKIILFTALFLAGCGSNSSTNSYTSSSSIDKVNSTSSIISSNSNVNSSNITSSSEQPSSSTSSEVIDYGTVTFDDIYIHPDGYDGVKIRPFFSNLEMEGTVDFTYELQTEDICEIDDEGKVWYINEGSVNVKVTSEIYGETSFYVYCQKTMKPEFVYSTAKDMTKSIINYYEDGDSLFVGDSFFQFWRDGTNGIRKFSKVFEDYKAFNIGISAATTHDLRAMNDCAVSMTNPKNIIVNIGINNVDDDSENGVKCFWNIKALVDDYLEMFEETIVYYLSITRCSGVFANKWNDHFVSNMKMKEYCESKDRLHYLDVMELYGDAYASYQSDGLHPNQDGYDLFEQIIKENVEFDMK